ncbi:hypothetical protein PALB_19560 [Pseudoalteromonas luteoviolacea B = ATCC 29581]|nr:hypothetical protein PALB_19560 [Pseudoalteromonas luteoviolacea B = ATCC 29581]
MISAILKEAGISGQNIELPAKRTNYYLQTEQIDFDVISPSWLSESELGNEKFVYSHPILEIKEFIVIRQGFQYIDHIHRKKRPVGTVRGYYYHDDNEFERLDFNSEKELLQALEMQRIDSIIVGDLPALYWGKKLDIAFSFAATHSVGHLHLRLLAKHQPLLDKLNQAISKLREEGRFTQIEQSYMESLHDLPHDPER